MMTDQPVPARLSAQPTPPPRLSPADLAALTAARRRVERANAELRAAQAAADLCWLNLQETYGIEQGDKLNPTTGEILRAERTAP